MERGSRYTTGYLHTWLRGGLLMMTVFTLPVLVVLGVVFGILVALAAWVIGSALWLALAALTAWAEGVFDDE
jgi:hypothetical protein